VAPLSDAELQQKTAFKDWTINRVIQHLHVWNLAAGLSLKGDGSFETYYSGLEAHRAAGGTMGSYETEWLGGLAGRARLKPGRPGLMKEGAFPR
jgi:hypothetical protein